jgi:hypothetical protein
MERFRGDQRVETPHMLVVPSRSLSLSARAGRKGGRKRWKGTKTFIQTRGLKDETWMNSLLRWCCVRPRCPRGGVSECRSEVWEDECIWMKVCKWTWSGDWIGMYSGGGGRGSCSNIADVAPLVHC